MQTVNGARIAISPHKQRSEDGSFKKSFTVTKSASGRGLYPAAPIGLSLRLVNSVLKAALLTLTGVAQQQLRSEGLLEERMEIARIHASRLLARLVFQAGYPLQPHSFLV